MKKQLFFVLIILFLFSTICFGSSFSIRVDPKIEALSILNYLAHINPWPKNGKFPQYKADVDTYFSKAYKRKHPALDMIQLLRTFGFKNETPYLLLLHLSDDFTFLYPKKTYIEISEGIGIPGGALKKAFLKKFIFEFKAFYYDYKFDEFYKNHLSFYKNLEDNVKNLLPLDLVSVLEDFFKTKSLGYEILLSPSLPVNYGLYIKTPYGFKSFAVMSVPFLPQTEREKLEYVYQIIKELVRAFVEPIDFDYIQEIKRFKKIASYNMVTKKMPTYKLVNEIIVSAVASHLMKVIYSDKEEAWAIVKEEKKGYYLVRPLAKFLEKYYNNIDKYQNFAQFYPEIINYLSKINRGELKVELPQNIGTLLLDAKKKKGVVFVWDEDLPSFIEEHLHSLAKIYKKKGYKVTVKSKKEYIKDLKKYKDKLLILYSSSENTNLMEKLFSKVTPPIDINNNSINFLGFNYTGDYIFIAKIPNSFLKSGYMIIITTNKSKLLSDIDPLNYLPFNYVILGKNKKIIQGGFQKIK